MGSTHLSLHYHLVWSTKSREQWRAPASRNFVYEYLAGVIRGLGRGPYAVGRVGDHIHVFAGLHATHSFRSGVRELKRCLLALLLERLDCCNKYSVVLLRSTTGYALSKPPA